MPVMVCMDGFILTHAYERIDMPTQDPVDGVKIGGLGIICFRPWLTAAVRYALADAERVVVPEKSLAVGLGYILVPCPRGWGHGSDATVRMARLAKETGLFPVFEAEHGVVNGVSKIRRLLPVEE